MNIFPSISLEMPEMCVETLRTGLVFLRWSIWGVTYLGLIEKWKFFHLSPSKCHKCVLKPSEQGSFFWNRLIWGVTCLGLLEKWTFLPSISLEMPEMCVVTIRTGLVFLRWLIWGVTCLGLLEKWMFSFFHQSAWQLHKWVLELSEQGLFLWDDRFEGSHV